MNESKQQFFGRVCIVFSLYIYNMYIIYAVRRIGFFVKRHIEQGKSEKGKTDTSGQNVKREYPAFITC
ncbi:hypothetical protein DAPPUDRAFT_306399 [Daphnia pulex]|uniref:Uncharacterized protein n=1 Tax=Daphnia pulex TaxID=6669 RepID=E9FYJ3_DAPPU|nr:hypothetical protein DAPPUDRAFT_306399 [Daphnia pulex]|eukprot:EFX87756.1 hypothetical protein DAPPUDRAFT_306399 [Daphnia pulex]